MVAKRQISVFIASPGDLAVERRAFRDCFVELNDGFADGAGVEFIALGWEDTLATTGRRNQGVINQDIDRCDVFILTMHCRWGQEVPDSKFSSYTEEEFHLALARFKETGSPEIFVILKQIPTMMMADPGEQLKKVLDFRKELEKTRQVLYREYEEPVQFSSEVDRHLRAYAKGELPKPDAGERDVVMLPVESIQAIREAKEEATKERERAEAAHQAAEAAEAKADELALTAAEHAAQAALDGHVEEARQTFARVTESTTNLKIPYLAYEFYRRTGDLDAAEQMMQRSLALSGPDAQTAETAGAYGNLGLIYQTRGELDQAEKMHRRSLEIEQKLGNQKGIGTDYGNLGLIYQARGELDEAEKMHRSALELDEKLGHKEGIARHTNNLGLTYRRRGELDEAEKMHRRALELYEKLGNKEGMASGYAALGLIYHARGKLEKAEEWHGRGLAIEEALGRQQGMARQYGNLGLIYRRRGELNEAETMLRRAPAIEEKLGLRKAMAHQYANLGSVAEDRGNLAEARELWSEALKIYKKVGMRPDVERTQKWLDELDEGDGYDAGGRPEQ